MEVEYKRPTRNRMLGTNMFNMILYCIDGPEFYMRANMVTILKPMNSQKTWPPCALDTGVDPTGAPRLLQEPHKSLSQSWLGGGTQVSSFRMTSPPLPVSTVRPPSKQSNNFPVWS